VQRASPMRGLSLLAMFCLSGCTLYFDDDDPPYDPPPTDDDPWEGPSFCPAKMWCEDGVVVRTPPVDGDPVEVCPDPALREAVHVCETGCADRWGFDCGEEPCDPARAAELCYVPPEPARCDQDGLACSPEGTTEGCPAFSLCGGVVPVGECTCTAGAWACEEACNGGLCGPDAVAAAMVGTWTGTVDPPPFSNTYQVTLEFRADGRYRSACGEGCDVVFYYGSDGDTPDHRYHVLGQTSVGALVIIQIVFAAGDWTEGSIEGLRIEGDRMTFRFQPAWLDGCTRPFDFDLQRVAP
jgi:hypothetical protein